MKRLGNLNNALNNKPFLYRIELMDRFYNLLSNKELIFVKPSEWEDPLENLIFNATIYKNGIEYIHPSKNKIFGQCWSYEGDSYGLWKNYTTKKNDNGKFGRHMGVRITTTIEKLIAISKLNEGDFYYGVVDYLWKKDLELYPKKEIIVEALKDPEINENLLKSLLIKRKSYSYEREVRLLSVPTEKMINKDKNYLCHVKIDPKDFIYSVRFDPALNYTKFCIEKDKLVDKYGFNPCQVTQSTYFHKNKFVINI
ncbi:MAG: hypothetical protein PHF25_08135 [Candidatus Margulisbacteria bacterium]|nr:hypothetical protein [Candidatus Margulisiibacteriota bacterium]